MRRVDPTGDRPSTYASCGPLWRQPFHLCVVCIPPAPVAGSGAVAAGADDTIHVFSLASGHLYERFLKIMMQSVVQRTKREPRAPQPHSLPIWGEIIAQVVLGYNLRFPPHRKAGPSAPQLRSEGLSARSLLTLT